MRAGRLVPVGAILLLLLPSLAVPAEPGRNEGPHSRIVIPGSVVLFDEAHHPVYTVNPSNPTSAGGHQPSGGYAQFAKLLKKSGFKVQTLDYGKELTTDSLANVRVLVIGCSQADRGGSPPLSPIYNPSELEAIDSFVKRGGGLFLLGDWGSFADEVEPIANEFSVSFAKVLVHDSDDALYPPAPAPPPGEGDVFIAYEPPQIRTHPVNANVSRIELYRSGILSSVPLSAKSLVVTDDDAYYDGASGQVPIPAAPIAVALDRGSTAGEGRVIVHADTNIFESTEDRDGDGSVDLDDSDNGLWGVQAVIWLADLPAVHGLSLVSDETGSLGKTQMAHQTEAGTTTVFEMKLQNLGNVGDSFSVAVTPPKWKARIDIPGGNPVQLGSRESTRLLLIVEVASDAVDVLPVVFPVTARSVAEPTAFATVNASVQLIHPITLELDVDPPAITIPAGSPAVYKVTVRNLAFIVEDVLLVAPSPSKWRAELSQAEVSVEPGANVTVDLLVTPDATLLGGTKAVIPVTGSLRDNPAVTATKETLTTVLQLFVLDLTTPAPVQRADPGETAVFVLRVRNAGNGNDRVGLRAVGTTLGVRFSPSTFPLPYEGTVGLYAFVQVPKGSPANASLNLTVVVESLVDPAFPRAGDLLNLTVIVNPLRRIHITVDPPFAYAPPARWATFKVTIQNTGNLEDVVRTDLVPEHGWQTKFTYADIPLDPLENRTFGLSVLVPEATHAWVEDNETIRAWSLFDTTVVDREVAVAVVDQVHDPLLKITKPVEPLVPGKWTEVQIYFGNKGASNGADSYAPSIVGLPPGWGVIGPENISLKNRGDIDLTFLLLAPLDAPRGRQPGILRVQHGGGTFTDLPFAIEVGVRHAVELRSPAPSKTLIGGAKNSFSVTVINRGNDRDTFLLRSSLRGSIWPVTHPKAISLGPGESREVPVDIDVPYPSTGREIQVTVRAVAKGTDVNTTLELRGSVPGHNLLEDWWWLIVVLAAACVAAYLVNEKWKSRALARAPPAARDSPPPTARPYPAASVTSTTAAPGAGRGSPSGRAIAGRSR